MASRCSQLPHAAAERAKSFLVYQLLVYRCGIVVKSLSLLQDILCDLPRPHSLVPDEEFLHYYSLEAQCLTLEDTIRDSSLPE